MNTLGSCQRTNRSRGQGARCSNQKPPAIVITSHLFEFFDWSTPSNHPLYKQKIEKLPNISTHHVYIAYKAVRNDIIWHKAKNKCKYGAKLFRTLF